MVFEDQNARFVAGGLTKKMGGREPADASADDNQIVGFAGVDRLGSFVPESAVAEFVHGFK